MGTGLSLIHIYLIPQNFVDTGTILGGTVKLRNAVEAAVLAVAVQYRCFIYRWRSIFG